MKYDVVVVGGGPVGLTAASLLGKEGLRVALVERYQHVYSLPRAIRADGEVMRTWQSIGLVDKIADDIVPLDGYRWFGADGDEILFFDRYSALPAPSGWSHSYCCWQPAVDKALDEKARSWANVDVLRGWAVESIDPGPDAVELRIRHGVEKAPGQWGADDEQRVLTAAYVIGADGANSLVRESCGFKSVDFGFSEHWLVVDVLPHNLSRWPARIAEAHCYPSRPMMVIPNGPRHRRWEFMLVPGENPEDFKELERVWELLEPEFGHDEGELVRSAVYEFKSVISEEMRRGRVFLAGDAAHRMPPFMAEGLCSGIRDVANLCWRLKLVLRGKVSDSLLDAYGPERRPQNEAAIKASVQMGNVSCVTDPVAAAARDKAFRSGQVPPPPLQPRLGDGTHCPNDPVAGTLTPQGVVRAPNGRVGRTDDIVGTGFALICLKGDPLSTLDSDLLSFLGSIDCRIVSLDRDARDPFIDEDGVLTNFMEGLGIAAFIGRPDGNGFGAANDGDGLANLVRDLRDQIGSSLATQPFP